jgi:hypothetical protein
MRRRPFRFRHRLIDRVLGAILYAGDVSRVDFILIAMLLTAVAAAAGLVVYLGY